MEACAEYGQTILEANDNNNTHNLRLIIKNRIFFIHTQISATINMKPINFKFWAK
jgi:hypothetical protein